MIDMRKIAALVLLVFPIAAHAQLPQGFTAGGLNTCSVINNQQLLPTSTCYGYINGVPTFFAAQPSGGTSNVNIGNGPSNATVSNLTATGTLSVAGATTLSGGGTLNGTFAGTGNVGTLTATGNSVTNSLATWASYLAGASDPNAVVLGSTLSVGNSVKANAFNTITAGFPGTLGTLWQSQYHANWNVVQSNVLYNPTEWQIYTSAANGIAQVIGGTNQVVRVSGTNFDPAWVGTNYFYWNGSSYKVLSVSDTSHLTVQTTSGGTVTWGSTANNTYYYAITSTSGTVNTSGTVVTLVSGQPFISGTGITINGTAYTVATWNSGSSLTLSSSAGTQTGVAYSQTINIVGGNGAGELSNIRLQGLAGANEENFVITETPAAAVIQTAYAGAGQYRPILIVNGEQPAGTGQIMAGFYPNATLGSAGYITLGGGTNLNNEAVAIQPNASNVNYMLMQGSTTGLAPSIAFRGTDTTVGADFDVQGANSFTFSSHSFTNTEFQVFGNGGTSWLALGSSSSAAPTLTVGGSASNIAVTIASKGLSPVALQSPAQLAAFTVATLPSCSSTISNSIVAVTDANGPTYNGTLTGGGSVHVLALCNGTSWASH